jgi:alkylhydroperoxidase family enzyme
VGRATGLTEQELEDLASYESSGAFDERDRLVLRFATAMTATPAEVPDDLRAALVERFGPAGVAELAAAIAWENHRARLNRALGVRPAGFSDGAVCALPAPLPTTGDPIPKERER